MDIRLKKINDLLQKGLITQETYLESFDLLTQIPNEAHIKTIGKAIIRGTSKMAV